MKKSLFVLSTAALVAFAGSAVAAPALDGAKLLDERCSVCHKSERPKAAKKSMTDWDKTVTRMMGTCCHLGFRRSRSHYEVITETDDTEVVPPSPENSSLSGGSGSVPTALLAIMRVADSAG